MGTAKQLIPALVEAEPLTWDRAYSKNMRPIRGYPDYWRITDSISYIDGPPSLGQQYTKDLFTWQARILRDDNGDLSETLEVTNLGDYLEPSSSTVNGETVYKYKYNSNIETYSYTHTDPIDSVSLEFDQSGRRLIAFESMGDVHLIWYDPNAQMEVVTNFGPGVTPHIVTDSYHRTAPSISSERLLFYIKTSTKQLVYRKQLDRYQIEYTLPDAPSDIVELFEVSKNLYGGLTTLFCYENVSGDLVTGSFTARAEADVIKLGTDGNLSDEGKFSVVSGTIPSFVLKLGLIGQEATDSSSFVISSGTISSFDIASTELFLSEQTDTASFGVSSGTVSSFNIREPIVRTEEQTDSSTFLTTSGTLSEFELRVAVLSLSSEAESSTFSVSSGTLTTFTLG